MEKLIVQYMLVCAIIIILVMFIYKQHQKPPQVNTNVHDGIRKTLQLIDLVFAMYGIMYWVDGGTILGAVRHQDVIPWDDDGDVIIFNIQREKFVSTIPVWKRLGYGVTSFYGGYKVFNLNGKSVPGRPYKFPFVDVFVCQDDGDRYNYADATSRKYWPNGYWLKKEVFPLRRYTLDNTQVWGPCCPHGYFVRNYGEKWQTHGRIGMDHSTGLLRSGNEFRIPTK